MTKKLSPAERLRRQHDRKAAKVNTAEREAYGPMFAYLAPVVTADDMERRWRGGRSADDVGQMANWLRRGWRSQEGVA